VHGYFTLIDGPLENKHIISLLDRWFVLPSIRVFGCLSAAYAGLFIVKLLVVMKRGCCFVLVWDSS
jgi:hypothetical protein